MSGSTSTPGPQPSSVSGPPEGTASEERDEVRPGFWEAVTADARATAGYRGERRRVRSRADAAIQVVRLMWVTDTFLAQVCYRAAVATRSHRVPVVPGVLHRLAVATGQICIGAHVHLGPGAYIPHGQVRIDGDTVLGREVVLRPFSAIGCDDGGRRGPRIGPRARISTGATVVGPVRVGAGAQIGANAFVTVDVPGGEVVVGVPAGPRRP